MRFYFKVRKWLGYRRKQKDALVDLIPSGLTDERKVQLQSVIANIRERFPVCLYSSACVFYWQIIPHYPLFSTTVFLRGLFIERGDKKRWYM